MKYAIACTTAAAAAEHIAVNISVSDEFGGTWTFGRWANNGEYCSGKAYGTKPPELVMIELKKVWEQMLPGFVGAVDIEKVNIKGKEYLSIEFTTVTEGTPVVFTGEAPKKKQTYVMPGSREEFIAEKTARIKAEKQAKLAKA